MLSTLRATPRDAEARAAAGKLCFLIVIAWFVLTAPLAWLGDLAAAYPPLTIAAWYASGVAALAVVLPRLKLHWLLALGPLPFFALWAVIQVLLGFFFFLWLGGSLALWLYWRDLARREQPDSAPNSPSR